MKNITSIFKFYGVTPYSLHALKNNYIHCSHYSTFNDPFECWCSEESGIPNPNTEPLRYEAAYKAWGFDLPDYSENGIQELNHYCEQFIGKHTIRVSDYIESARICCFSKKISDLLMWSHYGNGLRGFCVEFDPSKLIDPNTANIIEVKYKRKPESLDTLVCMIVEDQIDFHEMVIYDEYRNRKLIPSYHREHIRPFTE
jgi:hypothetical protein